MPVPWNSIPPQFQLDPESVENFIIAKIGQKFGGVVNVLTGMVYIHPCEPEVGKVDFKRDGDRISVAMLIGVGGGPHAWVVARIARDLLNQPNYAGFSLVKGYGLNVTVRSGLNTIAFTDPPPPPPDIKINEEEMGRIMPQSWARPLETFLDANLPVPDEAESDGCVIV